MDRTYEEGAVVFDHWIILRSIGSGSFGRVYEIQRKDFGETYRAALKVISVPQSEAELRTVLNEMTPSDAEKYFYSVVEDVVREFAIMAKLKGTANVVGYEDHQVIRHGEGIGWDILIRMELLTPVLEYASQHPFSRRDVIRLGIDMCRALELCQKYNIIHRDIKPDNIFVSDNGDFKLGDFGIARTIERTMSGLSQKGTYNYMAPEVYHGTEYGFGVDIYSLGMVLYRLLNRNRVALLPQAPAPITYSDRQNAIDRRMSGETLPKPYYSQGRLAEIVLKACAYDPKDRYSSPAQMRQELEAILYEQSEAELIYPDGDELSIRANEYVPISDSGETQKNTATVQEEAKTANGRPSGHASVKELVPDEEPSKEKTEEKSEKTEKKQNASDGYTVVALDNFPRSAVQLRKRKKKARLLICTAVFLLMVVSIGMFWRQRSLEKKELFQQLMNEGTELCETDPKQAKELFLQAQELCPEETAAYVSYAYALYCGHDYNECIAYIEDELAMGKNYDISFQNQLSEILAVSYFEKGDYTEAAAYFRLSSAGGDIAVPAMRDYAVSLGRIGDVQASEEVLDKMLAAGAKEDETNYVRAETKYALGEYVQAETAFSAVLNSTSDPALQRRCVRALAELYRDCAELNDQSPIKLPAVKEAQFLDEAIIKYGLNFDSVLWEMLGLACYEAKNEYLSSTDQSSENIPDPEIARDYLVRATEAFQHVIDSGMAQEYIYDNIFNILYELEDYASAEEHLKSYASAYPQSYLPHALRSMLLITIEGSKDQSSRNYEEAFEEYQLAGSLITGSDDTTYYQQLNGLIQKLQDGGWL